MENLLDKKISHLNKLTDENGMFKIVAIDHREVYIDLMKKMGCPNVDKTNIVQSKLDIIETFNQKASGFLLDPDYSLEQAIEKNILNNKGLMVGIEGNDYSDVSFKDDYLTDKISITKIAEIDADCVKLFIYYYFDEDILQKQIALINKVSETCKSFGLPFLIEPILAPKYQTLPIAEQIELNKKMVLSLSELDVDIFKLLFPTDINAFSEETCVEQCKYVTSSLNKPYILLTSGVEIQTFYKQLKVFCMAGGSGFAIGRSLWGSCVNQNHDEIATYKEKMLEIFDNTCKIVTLYGKRK